MNHPFELLAGYVDGALPEGERAVVDAHLRGCAECRADLGLAREARQALASLADEPVPAGVGARATAEASSGSAQVPQDMPVAHRTPRWYRVSGLAAAAAVVGLLAIALPRLGSEGEGPGAPEGTELNAAGGGSRPVEPQARDYTEETLGALAKGTQIDASAAASEPGAPTSGDASASALECLYGAYPHLAGEPPVRLIRARFRGTDAYIGVFETGPGAGEPADMREVLAASVRGCRLLSYAGNPI